VIVPPPQNRPSAGDPEGSTRRSLPSRPDNAAAPQCQRHSLLLKIPEAAAELRIGLTKMYELLGSGEIRSIKVGPNATRVPYAQIEAYIARKLADRVSDPATQ